MTRKEMARSSGNCSTPHRSSADDEHILSQYERGTRYAAWLMFGMFAFMAAWMWFTW